MRSKERFILKLYIWDQRNDLGDDAYSRNAPGALNLMSTFLLFLYITDNKQYWFFVSSIVGIIISILSDWHIEILKYLFSQINTRTCDSSKQYASNGVHVLPFPFRYKRIMHLMLTRCTRATFIALLSTNVQMMMWEWK
jgi:hypothetical protein